MKLSTPIKRSYAILIIVMILIIAIAGAIFCLATTTSKVTDSNKIIETEQPTTRRDGELIHIDSQKPTETPKPSAKYIPPTHSSIKFSQETIEYFVEVALHDSKNNAKIVTKLLDSRNPTRSFGVRINGDPTTADQKCIDETITEFNGLSKITKLHNTLEADRYIDIYYISPSIFKSIIPSYKNTTGWRDLGYMALESYGDNIATFRILVSKLESNSERCYITKNEIIHVLGIDRNSKRYDDSILSGTDRNPTYSNMDLDLLRMLYTAELPRGFNEDQVREFFK